MRMRKLDPRLAAVLLIAFVLRLAYAVGTPAWQAADEYPHFWVAQHIASSGEFPPSVPVFPSYEAFQPPLYYVLSAGVLRLCGCPELAYTEQMIPPPAPLLILRFISVLLGVGTVWVLYRTAKKAWPGGGEAPLLASLFAALLPAFVVVSSSVTIESLLAFLSSIVFLVIATPLKDWTPRTGFAAGLWVGLAILTKLSGLVLLVPLAWRCLQLRSARKETRVLLAAALGTVLPVGVLVVRDLAMYGRFPAVNPGLTRELSLSLGHVAWSLRNLIGSYFFAAGRLYEIRPPAVVYALALGPMLLVALVGWLRRSEEHCAPELRWPLIMSLVCGVALSLLYTLSYTEGVMTSWGKNLYPALTAVAIFSVDGWQHFHPISRKALPRVFLALLAVGCVWGFLQLLRLPGRF
jgi:hypothetical protein